MKINMFGAAVAIIAFSTAVVPSPVLAQKPGGILYALHSAPSDACPALDWHITVTGNNLEGFVAASHTTRMWRLDGTVSPASAGKERTFEMQADEIGGGGRKAVIKGSSGGEYVHATITGAGLACDGKTLVIPRVQNGVEGGGG